MGRIRILTGITLALALAIPGAVVAAVGPEQQNVVLAKGDNRTGTYYAFGQTVTVDGDVNGDVACGAQTVVINGSVEGDVLCAAQTITVNGAVKGSVRAAGQLVILNSNVGRNVTVGAQNFVLGKAAKVAGEVAAGAQSAKFSGPVEQSVYVGAEILELESTIGGNLTAYIESLKMSPTAVVEGNFDYTSHQTFRLSQDQVQGEVARHTPVEPARTSTVADKFSMLLYWLAAALMGALIMVWLAPRLVRSVTTAMLERWQASLGWGALILLATPIALFVLIITVIGLPAVAVLGALWIIAIALSGLFSGIAIGSLAWQRALSSRQAMLQAAVVGIPLVLLAGWLPWIGGLVGLLAAAWTLGGMALALYRVRSL